MQHAATAVPYWRDLFAESGVDPSSVRSLDDLQGLPISTKTDLLRAGPEKFLDPRVDRRGLFAHHTSGTTGEPFIVYRSKFEEHLLELFRYRQDLELGLRVRDRKVLLADVSGNERPHEWPRIVRERMGIFRTQTISCLQPIDRIAAELRTTSPDVLLGYANLIGAVARQLDQAHELRPRIVLTGGEMLRPPDAEAVRSAFGQKPIETYGATECNLIGHRCPDCGDYHVVDDSVLVEVVRDGHPVDVGEQGEVVVTVLHATTMPFIRYALGDLAIRGPGRSPCGAPFSSLRAVEGRSMDFFQLPDGGLLHPYELTAGVYGVEDNWVARFQLTQVDLAHVHWAVEARRPPSREELELLRAPFQGVSMRPIDVTIELVDSIPREASGKLREFRSLVQSP